MNCEAEKRNGIGQRCVGWPLVLCLLLLLVNLSACSRSLSPAEAAVKEGVQHIAKLAAQTNSLVQLTDTTPVAGVSMELQELIKFEKSWTPGYMVMRAKLIAKHADADQVDEIKDQYADAHDRVVQAFNDAQDILLKRKDAEVLKSDLAAAQKALKHLPAVTH